MDLLFLVNVFRFYSGLRLRFTKNTVRKNLFLSVCQCFDENISLLELDQEFPFGGLMVMETLTWTKFSVFPKCSDYMQYYMMLPALFICTTAKDRDTVI